MLLSIVSEEKQILRFIRRGGFAQDDNSVVVTVAG
jgi:hypothetical protein